MKQIVWFDETHRKVSIGPGAGTKSVVFFGRNKLGEIDPMVKPDQELWDLLTKIKVEVRMCGGVAKIQDRDGNIKGVKTELLDYSNRTIKSIKVYGNLAREQINNLRLKFKDKKIMNG